MGNYILAVALPGFYACLLAGLTDAQWHRHTPDSQTDSGFWPGDPWGQL